jgi:hypothetical protein
MQSITGQYNFKLYLIKNTSAVQLKEQNNIKKTKTKTKQKKKQQKQTNKQINKQRTK